MTVIAIGEATVDWLCLERGRTLMSAASFYRYAGGNTANVAIGLSRLGVPVKLVAKIGKDFHGQYLRNILTAEGVDLSALIEDARYHTAQCYMTMAEDGSPIYRNWPKPHAADMLGSEDIEEKLFDDCSLVHSTGISLVRDPRRSAVLQAFSLCRARDIILSFDACFPTGQANEAKEAAMLMMKQSHLLKLNLEELAFWSNSNAAADTTDNMVARIHRICPDTVAVIVTLGAEGALLFTPAGKIYCPAKKVSTVCDVGAGDAFMAGLIYALIPMLPVTNRRQGLAQLKSSAWELAGKAGTACGALCTLAIGATESCPRREELESLLV